METASIILNQIMKLMAQSKRWNLSNFQLHCNNKIEIEICA